MCGRRWRAATAGLAAEARDVEVVPQAGPVARPDDENLVAAIPCVEDLLGLDVPVAAAQAVQPRDVGVLVGQALAPVAGVDHDGVLHVDPVAARPGLGHFRGHGPADAPAGLFLPERIEDSHRGPPPKRLDTGFRARHVPLGFTAVKGSRRRLPDDGMLSLEVGDQQHRHEEEGQHGAAASFGPRRRGRGALFLEGCADRVVLRQVREHVQGQGTDGNAVHLDVADPVAGPGPHDEHLAQAVPDGEPVRGRDGAPVPGGGGDGDDRAHAPGVGGCLDSRRAHRMHVPSGPRGPARTRRLRLPPAGTVRRREIPPGNGGGREKFPGGIHSDVPATFS